MKHFGSFILLVGIASAIFGQAIGYQGKNFIVTGGYIPANNVSAIIFDNRLADDYYSNDPEHPDENDPILFLHLPKVELEYAIQRYGSVFLRYNPYKQTANIPYFDLATEQQIDYIGVETKGNMISLGYRWYTSGNIAPLGGYLGFYATYFMFNSDFAESKFSNNPLPEEFNSYPTQSDQMMGLFVQYGVKNIFWDRVVFDVQIDGGTFLKKSEPYFIHDFNNDFDPNYLESKHDLPYYSIKNSKLFFLITPSLNVGFLLF